MNNRQLERTRLRIEEKYRNGEIPQDKYDKLMEVYWQIKSYPHGSGLIEPPSSTKK